MSSKGYKLKKTLENRILKGRGGGERESYIPFIQAHDNKIASEGWITRHLGWKTRRIHHTLSNHERDYLYFLEWHDEVIDIREQYPLLPQERTEEIAEMLGIKHPHLEGVPVVMTTDFLITLATRKGPKNIVRTVKPASRLSKRTLELFEIERRFFMEQGIDWRIVTENSLPKVLIRNVDWLCEAKYLDQIADVDEELINLIKQDLLEHLIKGAGTTNISKLCLHFDKVVGLKNGSAQFIMQHMIVNKKWGIDMNTPIKESMPLKVFDLERELYNADSIQIS